MQQLQAQLEEHEVEPPLCEHHLTPRVNTSRSYRITPIADLAVFRPKVSTGASSKHQAKPYGKPKGQSTWKLNKKCQSEHALCAVTRRKEQEELGTSIKAYQRVHIRKTQVESIRADVDASDITAEASV